MTQVLERWWTQAGERNEQAEHTSGSAAVVGSQPAKRFLRMFSPPAMVTGTNAFGVPPAGHTGCFYVADPDNGTTLSGFEIEIGGPLASEMRRIDDLAAAPLDSDYSNPHGDAVIHAKRALAELAARTAHEPGAFQLMIDSLFVTVNGAGEYQIEFSTKAGYLELLIGSSESVLALGSFERKEIDSNLGTISDAVAFAADFLRADVGGVGG